MTFLAGFLTGIAAVVFVTLTVAAFINEEPRKRPSETPGGRS